MAIHFHPLTVKEIRKETPDCVAVTLDVPNHLQQDFCFVQGQNITVKKEINGEELRRSYSICSAPHEKNLTIAVKQVEGGKFSSFANHHLQEGDVLDIMPPAGKFNTPLNAQNKKNYTAFAAGSGITPVISIIKATLMEEPASTFTLVFVNKNRSSIIFFEELEALKNKYLQRFNFINLLTRERTDADIFFGRINNSKLTDLGKLISYTAQDEFFICGPEDMIFCVRDFLTATGVDNKKIHFELFGRSATPSLKNKKEANPDKKNILVSVTADGRSFDFSMADSNTILDAALQQGADLPYACKGGMCCTCKAKLISGRVNMEVNWGLEQDELDQGFILTCQAHPASDTLVIDFDARK